MHVLLLPSWYPKSPNDVGGVFFRDQALALYRHGHKVGVIAPSMRSLRTLGKASSKVKLPSYEDDDGLLTYRKELFAALPRIPYGNYHLFRKAARELLERYIAENGKPDILHAHAAVYAGAAGAELSEEFGIPYVLTEHSSGFARRIYSHWQLKLAEKAIQSASACIAVSPSLADLLSEQFPSSRSHWKWIPNVVAERFKKPDLTERKEQPVRFLNLALMTEKKGQFDLIQAFGKLVSNGLNAELWLAGNGPIRPELEKTAVNLGIADKVRFMGSIEPDKVPDLLAQTDVMVVSSYYETFGVVAAEALMAGVPVVATRCGGPECIVEEGDGVLVPLKQPFALQEGMRHMGENLPDYNPIAIAERAKARFSGSAIASRLTTVYHNVLSASASPNRVG
ncbi:glycosyltransferase [Chromohalobacter nigrandesensis]|uniref:glycosyltransferase n=1 Tax=Chromohalobacter nigrandesensis TaxID=119863 RepID=UPI001FF199EA|nr:glycosyltransferase [Chromohalobacter nigrandesensis]MCK0743689.1 glycosyltransferase [Chromohalobacter nigrandesensis]